MLWLYQFLQLANEVVRIQERLEEVKQDTDPLAWQTRDAPEFELPEEITEYIQQINDVLESEGRND